MKTTTRTARFTVRFIYDSKLPHVLSLDVPAGFSGDDIYFSESDGCRAQDWLPHEIIPPGGKLESNGREAWISHWNDEILAPLHDTRHQVEFTQTSEIDEDGEETWLEDSAKVIPS